MTSTRLHIREPYRSFGGRIEEIVRNPDAHGATVHAGRNLIWTATLSGVGVSAGGTSGSSDAIEVAVKAFRVPSRVRGFIYARLRPSKALRSMEHAQRLAALGIGTPEPVASIEVEDAGCLRESYYICRYWPSDVDLSGLLYRGESFGANMESLLEQLAGFTLLQHDNGVLHLDYNPGNILVRSTKEGFHFALVDLNRLRFKAPDIGERISALVRLTTSADHLRTIGRRYAIMHGTDPNRFCRRLERSHLRFLRRVRAVKRFKSWLRRGLRRGR